MATAPVVHPENADIKPEVFRKEYQPKDAQGQPIGPPQVFEGTSWQEVTDKIAQAHEHASVKIQELKRAVRPTYADPVPEFKPRELTADELFKIHQDLQDPSKLRQAFRTLSEAEYGAPPEKIRESLGKNDFSETRYRVEREAQKFMDKHPDYVVCGENWEKIQGYFESHKDDKGRYLAATADNFEMIYEDLKAKQLLRLQAPVTEVPAPTEPGAITPKPTTRPRAATTGLFSQHSSASGPAKPTLDVFAQEVAKMPAQEYRRRINSDPSFRKQVEQLGKAASR